MVKMQMAPNLEFIIKGLSFLIELKAGKKRHNWSSNILMVYLSLKFLLEHRNKNYHFIVTRIFLYRRILQKPTF